MGCGLLKVVKFNRERANFERAKQKLYIIYDSSMGI